MRKKNFLAHEGGEADQKKSSKEEVGSLFLEVLPHGGHRLGTETRGGSGGAREWRA